MSPQPPPPPQGQVINRLQQLFKNDPSKGRDSDGAWSQAWANEVTPWDTSDVQPALKELIDSKWEKVGLGKWGQEGSITQKGEKSLVAGCGRGYDAIFFGSKGLDSLGIDLAPLAIEAAKVHYQQTENAPTGVNLQAADFFAFEPPQQGFSLAYDYTFFCALPPEMRQRWADRYAEIIKKDGVLITLEWPIAPGREGGPPYSVTEEIYAQHLGDDFEKIFSEKPGTKMVQQFGREVMAVWRRDKRFNLVTFGIVR